MTFMWIFTDKLSVAFDSFLIGLVGFVLLPYTSVFYALTYSVTRGGPSGFGWFLVAFGAFLDLGSWFGSGQQAQHRQRQRVIVVRDERL